MEMRVGIDTLAEGLDDRDNTGLECFPRRGLKIEKKRLDGTAAKIAQEPTLELEKDAQHLGDREDHLAVWDIHEERLPHPLPPLLKALGMTGGTEPPGLAGKHQKMLRPAVRTADAGKPAPGVAAVQTSLRGAKRRSNLMHWRYMMRSPRSLRSLVMAFGHFLDDRTEEPIVLLEAALIPGQELVEGIKQHRAEDSPLRTPRTIDFRHAGRMASRNGPWPRK
jgi:hypothetical protein